MIGSTMANLLQEFKKHVVTMAQELEDLGFFQNRGKLPMNQQAFLGAALKGIIHDSEWDTVLFELTEILHALHQREVVILIDEYDSPTFYAVQHEYFPEVCPSPGRIMCTSDSPSQADEFFRKVFSTLLKVGISSASNRCAVNMKLQNNEHLRGALLVGILRVAKAGWFSGLNNISVRLFIYSSPR
jgi:Predicted AAA-ATPase